MAQEYYPRRGWNLVPISYAFRPRLRGRLTLRRRTLRRNPEIFGADDSHIRSRYLCQHLRFCTLHGQSPYRFKADRMLPYHSLAGIRVFGAMLSPVYYRRYVT